MTPELKAFQDRDLGFSQYCARYNLVATDTRVRDEYMKWFDEQWRQEGMIEAALEEGLAKGRAEGLAQGLAKGKAEGKAKGLAEGKAERDALAKRVEELERRLGKAETPRSAAGRPPSPAPRGAAPA